MKFTITKQFIFFALSERHSDYIFTSCLIDQKRIGHNYELFIKIGHGLNLRTKDSKKESVL